MNRIEDVLKKSGLTVKDCVTVREYKYFKIKGDVKKLFIEAFQLVDKTVDKYEHLPEYDAVIEWLKDSKGKGLFLTGNNGRGKSIIVNGVIPLLFRIYHNRIITPIPARLLHLHSFSWSAAIDDVGQDTTINNYGTKIFAVDSFISDCEDNMKLLIMSSNFNKKQLVQKYGSRIEDRIKRLCKVIPFEGKSLRK